MKLETKCNQAVRMLMRKLTDMKHKPTALSRAGTQCGCGKPENQRGKQPEHVDKPE